MTSFNLSASITLNLKGLTCFTGADFAKQIHVTHQTLWRWGKGARVLEDKSSATGTSCSATKAKKIDLFANHIEPIEPPDGRQRNQFQEM